MKEIYLSEEELSNLAEVGQRLFCCEDEPQSASYKRNLVRPNINYISIILHILLPIVFCVAYLLIMDVWDKRNVWTISALLIMVLFYVILNLKKTVICFVKIYQRYAPAHIRNKCRFEPSCSQYMILAIEKYGFIKGILMGIDRLKRCNINNGGYDYP